MNSTKQKILSTSLQLFNERGISDVSLRTISDELGISVGNLQYHFKKREDIVEALYFQLVEEIDGIEFVPRENMLESVMQISTETFKKMFQNRFFLLDFVSITRKNGKIKRHYAELSKRRIAEFLQVIELLIQHSVLREERLKGEYHGFYKRLELMSNFWFSSVLIQSDELTEACVNEYQLMIAQNIYPYLTSGGREMYAEKFPELMS
jgi:AcrR family transcriptional regulator